MGADHLLALDAGTSGARCVIVRSGGETVAVARGEWDYQTPPEIAPLGKSFDPEAFWSILCDVTRRALAGAGLSGGDIVAVGVTSQRLGVVVVDGDGRVLFTGPNVDARAFAEGMAIDSRLAERVYASTGKLPSLLLAPARLHWLRKHQEADYERAAAVLAIGDWVAYRLTGGLRSERSLAGDCGLLNITTCQRDDSLLADLDVPPRLLPPLISSQDVAGGVSPRAAEATGLASGTPVVIAGGDTQCALLGMGVEQPGDVGIAAGWSCPLQQVTAEPRLDPHRRTWTDLHVLPDRWVIESSTANAGHMWQWWCETLLGDGPSALAEGAALAAQAPDGAGEVLALLGPGAMNAGAMGLHLGGVLMTTPLAIGAVGRPQLLRAALENIGYALRTNLEQAQEVSGLPASRVAVAGGLTRATVLPRILAAVLDRPVDVAGEVEASARGAAILAARAVGMMEAVAPAATERIEPEAGAVETYRRGYERWRALGDALDRTLQELP